ncbi:MAG: hypothetical protein GX595_00585 [Lentisphaerae bacterium]|nr:hypothetical protein [Lentisphaerota bacterium]
MATSGTTLRLLSAALAVALAGQAAPAAKRVLMVAGQADNPTALALDALGVAAERCAPGEVARRSLFRYDLVVWGMDESRAVLAADPATVAAYLDAGGVMLCARGQDEDPWLPVPVRRDKAYHLGAVLQPDHAVFQRPHRHDDAALRDVHGGSIYRAFHAWSGPWVPLLSTGATQTWDKTPEAAAGEPHAGLIEMPWGAGHLIMLQMIPEYHWFRDRKGDPDCAGARFFANLLDYALGKAQAQAATRPPPERPEAFVEDLDSLLPIPCGFDTRPLDPGEWQVRAQGPYRAGADRRGVWTVTHEDVPSLAGSFCELTREVPLPADRAQASLRWYLSDTYCGGNERILGGAQHGQTSFVNRREGHRFAQVFVNGRQLWEMDLLGPNPQPARRRFYAADLADVVPAGAGTCRVTLRVEDRLPSGDRPFAIDVFWGAVEVLPGVSRLSATQVGGTPLLTLQAGQAQPWPALTQSGRVRLAVRLQDRVQDRPTLVLDVAGREVVRWRLSADDHRWHWAVTPEVAVRPGAEVRLRLEGDAGGLCPVSDLAVCPVPDLPAAADDAAPAPAAAVPAVPTDRVALRVTETAGVARPYAIATQGLPLAAGRVRDLSQIRLTTDRGEALPLQAAPLVTWPDGSIKVALVSFPVSLAANATATCQAAIAEAGAAAPAPADGQPRLAVLERGDEILIDTGAIQAVVSRTHGRLVESVRRADGRVLKRAEDVWDLAVEDEAGRVLRSGGPTVAATTFADRGPLRLLLVRTGSFADANGRCLDYRLQLEATAGAEALRLEAILVNRESTPEVMLRRWSMDFAGLPADQARLWLDAERTAAAGPGAVLYQHREDRLSWNGPGQALDWAEGRCPGWLRAGGVGLGVRWFWQRFPHALRFETAGLRYDLIPPALDDRDLPTRWQERLAEVTDRYTVGGVGYPQSPGRMGLFRLAAGEALHEEILMVFDGAPDSADLAPAMADLTHRPRAVPDPAYTSATRVFGDFQPAGDLFSAYETSVEKTYAGILAKREKRREYGFENFGDDTFEWGYGPSYTYWSNSEYDHHHGFLLQFLRSGDGRWWELGEQQARHYRDIVVPHAGAPSRRGGPVHHNATSLWMPQHPEQFWIADHTIAGSSCSHSWAEGMVDYWYLTGDPWAGEVVREMADWYCDRIENNAFGAGGQERGPGWALIAVSALAGAVPSPRLMRAGQTIADWIIAWQDPLRGVVSVPISEQPSYEGGSTFMHGIVGRGLGRWAGLTDDPAVRRACVGIAAWMTTEPMGAKGTFWYKQSPQNSRSFSATDQCLSALTYAHRFSNDPWYGDIALALCRRTGANVRSMSWYPQALGHIAALLTPAEVTLETEAVTAAPGQDPILRLRLRNTCGEALQAAVTATAQAPFEVAATTAPIDLPPGEERVLQAVLRTTAPTGRASVPVAVTLTRPDGRAETRRLSVDAMALDRLVDLRLEPAQAEVVAPMVLETLAGRPCLHTPRTPQTVLKPRPQDRPEGGLARFTVDIPVAGRYAILADVFWIDGEGNSLYIGIDDGPDRSFGNQDALDAWLQVEAASLTLTAGQHTLRVRTREDGARLGGLRLERRPGP